MKSLSDVAPSLSDCANFMSYATIPDVTLTYGEEYYTYLAYYMIITDKTLTCTVKKWSIVTNYPNKFISDDASTLK